MCVRLLSCGSHLDVQLRHQPSGQNKEIKPKDYGHQVRINRPSGAQEAARKPCPAYANEGASHSDHKERLMGFCAFFPRTGALVRYGGYIAAESFRRAARKRFSSVIIRRPTMALIMQMPAPANVVQRR